MKVDILAATSASLLALAFAMGCSSGGGGGGGNPQPLPPDTTDSGGTIGPASVYLTSTIGPSAAFMSMPCFLGTVTTELEIGSVASSIQDGTSSTSVTCSVTPSGSGYSVSVNVVSNGGAFAVSGSMPSTGTGTGITASLDYGQVCAPILFSGTNCSATLASASTPGFDPSSGPPIAPGRAWATVTCDDMTVANSPGHACEGILTFRVENCVGSP